jgi:molybdopterin biosynthesis enzyme
LPYEQRLHATALSDFKGAGFKEAFRRCVLDYDKVQRTYTATSTGDQSSGILTSMLYGNALAIVPAHQHIDQGEMIEVIRL